MRITPVAGSLLPPVPLWSAKPAELPPCSSGVSQMLKNGAGCAAPPAQVVNSQKLAQQSEVLNLNGSGAPTNVIVTGRSTWDGRFVLTNTPSNPLGVLKIHHIGQVVSSPSLTSTAQATNTDI